MKRQVRSGEQSFNEEAPMLLGLGSSFGGLQLELSSLGALFQLHIGLLPPRQMAMTRCGPFPWVGILPGCYKHQHAIFWVGFYPCRLYKHYFVPIDTDVIFELDQKLQNVFHSWSIMSHSKTCASMICVFSSLLSVVLPCGTSCGPIFALNKDSLCRVLWQTPNFMPVEN